MKVFAHRGYSGKYPENTLLAFEKAVELKSDGIELDIHLSKDGKLVVIHDEKLIRTTGKPGKVSDYTLKELKAINAGKTKNDKYGFTPIVDFQEYCDYISDKDIVTNIEIKTNNTYYSGIEEAALAMLKKYNLYDKVMFSSFNWLSIARIRTLAPSVETGLLQGGTSLLGNIGPLAALFGINYFHPDGKLLTEDLVKNCRKNNIGLNVWTVNDLEMLAKLKQWKVNSVITNEPELMLKNL